MTTNATPHELVPQPSGLPGQPLAAGYAAGAGDDAGLGAGEIWRIIKQRKLFIALLFVVFYLLVGAVTLVVYVFFPSYTAEGYFQLDPPPQETLQIEPMVVDPDIMQLQLESEARKMTHLGILSDVLAQPEVKNTYFYQWYADRGGNVDFNECLYDFQEYASATPIPDTALIRVRLSCQKKKEAQLLVRTLMDRYLIKYADEATRYYRERKEALGQTKTAMEAELEKHRSQMASFREQADIPHLESEGQLVSDHLAKLALEISMQQASASALTAQLRAVMEQGQNLPLTPEMKIIVESDPILRFWRQQVEAMDVEIAAARAASIGDNHRTMKTLRMRRDGYAALEAAKREELINDLRERELDNLRQAVATVRDALVTLQEDFAEQQAKRRDLDAKLQTFTVMQRNEERMQEELKEIDKAYREADHALADKNRIRLHAVQYPQEPLEPSRPSLPLYLGGGFLLALLGAFGLAFLREFTDTAVRTPADVARFGRVSVLGSVPVLDDEEAPVETIETAARSAPHSLVAEAFRQIRTNLLFSAPPEAQRSILITSPGAEDGKTAVAVNLAVSLARGSQKVLLIDCNFRRPALREIFANGRAEGLSNILVGQSTLEELASRTDIPNLDVLTTGPMPPAPAELLGTSYMRALIAEAVKRYERVLLDGPPILLVSDGLVLATQVDGVLLVARAVNNAKGALRRAREQLAKVNARVLGGVLNGVQSRPGGYFKRQYRQFYDYTEEAGAARSLPPTSGAKDESTEA